MLVGWSGSTGRERSNDIVLDARPNRPVSQDTRVVEIRRIHMGGDDIASLGGIPADNVVVAYVSNGNAYFQGDTRAGGLFALLAFVAFAIGVIAKKM